jgi:SAM-dependent methyltransferase
VTSEFDSYADEYQAAIDHGIAFSGVEHEVFLRAKVGVLLAEASKLGAPRELSMLDVGCGIGAFACQLLDHVGELHGVDISREAIARASRKLPQVPFASYEGNRLPYEGCRFDVAFAVCVFHHVQRSERAGLVDEMRRVTRPGGLIVLFEHNPWNPLTRLVVSRIPFDAHAVLLTLGEVRGLLREAGIARMRSRFILFVPSAAPRALRAERWLGWLPLGAQHVAVGSVPPS